MARRAEDVDFGAAFARHNAQVYKFLLRRTGDPHEAEELTQAVFVDAAAKLSQGERPHSLLAWLYAIAERRFVDELRRRGRSADVVRRAASEAAAPGSIEYGPEVVRAVRRSVGGLPVEQRRVVVMKVFEGRSFAEIARLVGASEGACKMRFARGITQVRDSLRELGIAP